MVFATFSVPHALLEHGRKRGLQKYYTPYLLSKNYYVELSQSEDGCRRYEHSDCPPVPDGTFSFGRNWLNFVASGKAELGVGSTTQHLLAWLRRPHLQGLRFLEVRRRMRATAFLVRILPRQRPPELYFHRSPATRFSPLRRPEARHGACFVYLCCKSFKRADVLPTRPACATGPRSGAEAACTASAPCAPARRRS